MVALLCMTHQFPCEDRETFMLSRTIALDAGRYGQQNVKLFSRLLRWGGVVISSPKACDLSQGAGDGDLSSRCPLLFLQVIERRPPPPPILRFD